MNITRHNHLFEPTYGETKLKINFLKSKIQANKIKREVERDEWRNLELRETPVNGVHRLRSLWGMLRGTIRTAISQFARRNHLRA
jgi:hypothetical protein